MTAELPSWFEVLGEAEPKLPTRQDLVERGALAVAMTDAWTDGDREPIAPDFSDDSHRDVMINLATAVLDAAYPVLTTADEIEALPQSTVIVNEAGRVEHRALAGGLGKAGGMVVGTLEVWEQPGSQESGRKPRRTSSATLALNGPWTVVWRVAS